MLSVSGSRNSGIIIPEMARREQGGFELPDHFFADLQLTEDQFNKLQSLASEAGAQLSSAAWTIACAAEIAFAAYGMKGLSLIAAASGVPSDILRKWVLCFNVFPRPEDRLWYLRFHQHLRMLELAMRAKRPITDVLEAHKRGIINTKTLTVASLSWLRTKLRRLDKNG